MVDKIELSTTHLNFEMISQEQKVTYKNIILFLDNHFEPQQYNDKFAIQTL